MSTSMTENGSTNDIAAEPQTNPCVPLGDYKVIVWDLSLTGRRVIDEMCHITASAVPGGKNFSQYVMPYRKPDLNSQRRNGFAVVTIGRYRALRDFTTGKILRTKSEFAALTDFLGWLEKNRGKDGVLLLSYESRKVIPYVLLEALRRYNLIKPFSAIVKGFVNVYTIAKTRCLKPVNYMSLHNLVRVVLEQDAELATPVQVSHAVYEVVQHLLAKVGVKSTDHGETEPKNVAVALCEFALSIEKEEMDLLYFKGLLQRQMTFRPVFGPMIQGNRRLRQNASVQKQLLAEAGLDYLMLSEAFKDQGKLGLAKLMENKMTSVSSKAREELLNVMMNHFDPPAEEVVTVPVTKQNGENIEECKVSIDKENGEGKVPHAKQNGEQKENKATSPKQNGGSKEEKAPGIKQNGERKGESHKASVVKQNGDLKVDGRKVHTKKQHGEHKGDGDKSYAAKPNGDQDGHEDKIPAAMQNGAHKGDGEQIPVTKHHGSHEEDKATTDIQNDISAGDIISADKINGEKVETKGINKIAVDTVDITPKTAANELTTDKMLKSENSEITNGGTSTQ